MSVTKHKQRADLTFKQNTLEGRHGWLRLTPAYSLTLVDAILDSRSGAVSVLDPFSGTSTTPLAAAYRGIAATGYELNPFLFWFGSAKCARFNEEDICSAQAVSCRIAKRLTMSSSSVQPPAIHNIGRWWNPPELDFLCKLKWHVDQEEPGPVQTLLLVSLCRLVIGLSNAAFNHQSMSFKDKPGARDRSAQPALFPGESFPQRFQRELAFVCRGASDNPDVNATILQGDARNLEKLNDDSFDLLITSPPYPNRMSYIRELRPYMYWLGYLKKPGKLARSTGRRLAVRGE